MEQTSHFFRQNQTSGVKTEESSGFIERMILYQSEVCSSQNHRQTQAIPRRRIATQIQKTISHTRSLHPRSMTGLSVVAGVFCMARIRGVKQRF